MKKVSLITLVMIFSAICLLCSCGDKEKSQYDETTNQHVSIFDISLQIPKEWDKEIREDDCVQYYEGNENLFEHGLNITLRCDGESLKETAETLKENLDISNKRYHDLEDITFSEGQVADMPAVTVEYTKEYNGEKYEYRIVVFQKNNEIIMMEFCSTDKIGIEDFNKVLNSVSIEE